MKFSIIFSFLFLSNGIFIQGKNGLQGFDRSVFYAVISSDKLNEINNQLNIIKESSIFEKDAFEGALLMKKSGLLTNVREKLSFFKAGRTKLESSISKYKDNTEYRFLRLIIQEHAPRIVKYRDEIDEDSQLIQTNFKNLSILLQQVIMDYSKNSTALKVL